MELKSQTPVGAGKNHKGRLQKETPFVGCGGKLEGERERLAMAGAPIVLMAPAAVPDVGVMVFVRIAGPHFQVVIVPVIVIAITVTVAIIAVPITAGPVSVAPTVIVVVVGMLVLFVFRLHRRSDQESGQGEGHGGKSEEGRAEEFHRGVISCTGRPGLARDYSKNLVEGMCVRKRRGGSAGFNSRVPSWRA